MPSTKKSSSRNGSASALKQGTLGFSAKRTNSQTTTKTKGPPLVRRSSSCIEKHTAEDAIDSEINIEEDSNDDPPVVKPAEQPVSLKRSGAPNATKASISNPANRLKDDPPVVEQRPTLDVSGKIYRKHYGQVRERMGHLEPIHAEGQNKIHQILRLFDMSYEYGPCVGMSRIERWERAASLGLNPPDEVRHILLTKEGVEKDEYSQSVLYGEV
ncbi:DNA polymerase delta, subunit 4-domain-containing protein [Suillus cothurnatus]|nr:DNA polymerase delta, subunit 4-domain-containing protein [Suillus cothurnatus]